MHLVIVGLNHRTAPIEIREKLAFPEHRLMAALEALRARSGLHECTILSTCNRTELYAVVPHAGHGDAVVRFLSEYQNLPEGAFVDHLYRYQDQDAVEHLFRVASGLDSLVLGEPQILRQVRDGHAAATQAGAIGQLLNPLFRAAIQTGRRARTETDIGRGGFSVGHAAVDLARSIFGSLHGATVLILGAGKMSELTARHLVASGVQFVMVANRTYDRACSLADRLGGKAIHYDEFGDRLAEADILISSTAAPTHVVRRDMLQPILRKRRGRPLFLIDIAVPRDIEPEAGNLENVFLYDVDDLEDVVAGMARDRAGEAGRVESIIAEEAARFLSWWRSLDAVPVVSGIKHKYEEIRQSELARLRNQVPDLSERAWQCIENATRSMMTRAARDPVETLRRAATERGNEDEADLIEAAREIFGLNGNGKCPGKAGAEPVATSEPEEAV